MCVKSKSPQKIVDRYFRCCFVGISKRQYFFPFIADGCLHGMSLAFDGFFYRKDLMILLYLELFKERVQIDELNLTLFSSQNANQVMVFLAFLHQRIVAFYIGLDHQLEIHCLYPSQFSHRVDIGQLDKTSVSLCWVIVRSNKEEINVPIFFSNNHNGVNGRKGDSNYFALKNKHPFKIQFLQVPDINSPILTPSCQYAIPRRCLCSCQLKMSVSDIPDKLELTLRISFIDKYPSVKGTYNKQRMLFQEYNLDNSLIFVFIIFPRLNFLKKISSLRTILPHKARSISYKKFTTLIAKLSCRDMSVMLIIVQFGEDFLKGASHQIINSNIIRSKQVDRVGIRTHSEIKDVVELVYLFRFLLERRCTELGYFLLTNQTLRQLWDNLKARWVDEVFLTVYHLHSLKSTKIPNSHRQLVIEGKDIRKRFQKTSSQQISSMLFVLPCKAFHQRNLQ